LISVVLAFIRLAMNLSKSGLTALSHVETTYHDGMFFQAATLIGSPKTDAARWICRRRQWGCRCTLVTGHSLRTGLRVG
jgi:hypothetical protein